MSKRIIFSSVTVAILLLSGCNEEETKDIAWWTAHAPERAAKVAECKGNPGEKMKLPNCINAIEADNKEKIKSQKRIGPIEPLRFPDWWADHAPERAAKIAECKANPEKMKDMNCIHAIEAEEGQNKRSGPKK